MESSDGCEYGALLYRDRAAWADVVPRPPAERSCGAFDVEYNDEYRDLIGYFSAVLESGEVSERALRLCEDVIDRMPSHYTAWWCKCRVLSEMGEIDFAREAEWINALLEQNPKNYQPWFYKEWLVRRGDAGDQRAFITKMLSADPKNFHLWSFALYYAEKRGQQREVYEIARDALARDVRNNSAWNARYVLGRALGVCAREEFAAAAAGLREVAQNEAAVNFALAMCEEEDALVDELEKIAVEMLEKKPDNFLAYYVRLYAETKRGNREEVIAELCEKLVEMDPIREPYYRLLRSGKVHFRF